MSGPRAGNGRIMTLDQSELADLRDAIEQTLERQIRPLLKLHGGGVTFVDVSADGDIELAFEGACRGCSLKSVTYALGVRQKLMPLPGVRAVRMNGVSLSDAALDRVEKYYSGYTPWVGSQPVAQ